MEGTPSPGWYADPADGTRHRYWDGTAWTVRTRSAGASTMSIEGDPKPWRSGLWVGLGLLVVAGIGTAAFFLLDSEEGTPVSKPEPSPSPSPTEPRPEPVSTTDPSEVTVPEGWSLYTSETGVLSYAVDPAWENLLGPGDQDYIHSYYSDMDDSTSEYSGAWLTNGSEWEGGTMIHVISYSDGLEPALLRYKATSFAHTEVDDLEILVDEEFTSAHGYEGWRLEYRATIDDITYPESVIMIKAGVTLVTVYGSTNEDTHVFTEDMLAVVDSIVVHHPPAEG